jgi:hypothetical protein
MLNAPRTTSRRKGKMPRQSRQIYDGRTAIKEKLSVLEALDLAVEAVRIREGNPGLTRSDLIRRGIRLQIRKAGLVVPK